MLPKSSPLLFAQGLFWISFQITGLDSPSFYLKRLLKGNEKQ